MTGVALTFDDGPDPGWTPPLLDALGACGAVATFFVLGPAVESHPELVARCVAEGHGVEVHGWDHLRHPVSGRLAVAADLDRTLALLESLGVAPAWWRLPWGLPAPWTPALARSRELGVTGWTADTHDWRGLPVDRLLDRVRPGLRADAIVLAHDGCGPGAKRSGAAETVALVEPLVAAIRARGLEPVRLEALTEVTDARGGSAPLGSPPPPTPPRSDTKALAGRFHDTQAPANPGGVDG